MKRKGAKKGWGTDHRLCEKKGSYDEEPFNLKIEGGTSTKEGGRNHEGLKKRKK